MGKPLTWMLGASALLFLGPASAQMYRCMLNGSSYISDRPCTAVPQRVDKLGSIGPERTPSPYSSGSYGSTYRSSRDLEKAPSHQKYLSGACASMADAIRTSPARGINYQVIRELRTEYDEKCREEDRAARAQAYEDERRIHDERATSLTAANRARDEQARSNAQCQAMRDILITKRQKVDTMTPGEQANFQTLQTSFNDRCVKGR